ncbi:hypothetical protein U1Q18_029596 [Sarracenia purpurea var. burkii]
MGYCTTSSVAKLAVQCGDVELEKKIDEKIDQFIDKVEKQPNKKNQVCRLPLSANINIVTLIVSFEVPLSLSEESPLLCFAFVCSDILTSVSKEIGLCIGFGLGTLCDRDTQFYIMVKGITTLLFGPI